MLIRRRKHCDALAKDAISRLLVALRRLKQGSLAPSRGTQCVKLQFAVAGHTHRHRDELRAFTTCQERGLVRFDYSIFAVG